MREHSVTRRERVVEAVRLRGEIRVADLAGELGVSVVTLRRDVEELARQGKLRRGHGVARSLVPAQPAAAHGGAPVGLIVPEHHSYLFEAVRGARTALEAAGVRMAMHIAQHVPGAEQAMARQALEQGARGLLIAPRWRTARAPAQDERWMAELAVPAVLLERAAPPGSALHAMDAVRSDHWYGAHLALEHLIGLGHRRIVLAARDDSPTARTLRAAFAQIAEARPEVEAWTTVLSSPHAAPERPPEQPPEQQSQRAPQQPSEPSPEPPPASEPAASPVDLASVLRAHGATAAVLHADVDALMLVQQLHDVGIRVPEDCSVVAYDDMVAALGSPPLTAVSPPKEELGRAAAELLLRRLEHARGAAPEAVRHVGLLPELKIRGSAVEVRTS